MFININKLNWKLSAVELLKDNYLSIGLCFSLFRKCLNTFILIKGSQTEDIWLGEICLSKLWENITQIIIFSHCQINIFIIDWSHLNWITCSKTFQLIGGHEHISSYVMLLSIYLPLRLTYGGCWTDWIRLIFICISIC